MRSDEEIRAAYVRLGEARRELEKIDSQDSDTAKAVHMANSVLSWLLDVPGDPHAGAFERLLHQCRSLKSRIERYGR